MSSNCAKIPGFHCCRNDRPNSRGGGVALFVSNNINYNVVYRGQNYGSVECLFIELLSGGEKMIVGVVYLPHGDFSAFEHEISHLLARYSSILIMGDFNNNLFDISKANNVRRACNRMNIAVRHNIRPTHFDPAHHSTSLLDFFLLSNTMGVNLSDQFFCPNISRHAFIFASLEI